MTSLKLGEVIVVAVVAKLQAGYAARVAAINAEKNDGLTISAPDTDAYYFVPEQSMPKAPAVMVVEGITVVPPGSEGPHSFLTNTDIHVYVIDEDPIKQRLATRLRRQARAVTEVLWDDAPVEGLTGSAWRIMLKQIRPGPLFEPDSDDAWRQWYQIVFTAEQHEG